MTDPDYNYIVPSGVIVPDTSTLLTDVQDEYKEAFQDNSLITTPDTPQGVLVTAETLTRAALLANNAAVANQINPNEAGGVALDAVMALTGMQRETQEQTVVPGVTLSGIPGTVVTAGSIAQTAAGDLFSTLSTVTFDALTGQATVDFASNAYGPIPCAIGALNMVVSDVLGWETVNNTNAGIPGTTTQSDQGARALRSNTLAFQGVSIAEAITSALYATAGVTSLAFRENYTKNDMVIDGIFLLANSVYACVAGGSDLDVAAALLENKSSGSNWNGNTTVNLIEPASGQSYPVKFDRPEQKGILIKVFTPNGNAAAITQAILDYAAGNINGLAGFVVGADVSPFELAGAIMAENPGFFITSVQISLTSPVAYMTSSIPIGLNQQAFTQASYILVEIG